MANPAAHPDMARFLGGAGLREEYRTNEELASATAGFSKFARATLSADKLAKLRESACEGLEPSFKMLDAIEVDLNDTGKLPVEKLKHFYLVTLRIEEFRNALERYDMTDVFTQIPTAMVWDEANNIHVPAAASGFINIFESYNETDMTLLRQYSKWATRWGGRDNNIIVENLTWSKQKILNSCEEDLRMKIEEEWRNWPVDERGGPVAFKLMTKHILSVTAYSVRSLEAILTQMAVTDFDGENVKEFVSISRAVLIQLSNNTAVPRDVIDLLTKGLQKCSTDTFVQFIGTLKANHSLKVMTLTHGGLLSLAEEEYTRLVGSNSWVAKATSSAEDSAFFSGCYTCGSNDHWSRECPQNAGGRGGRGGRGRGGGRGGQGRGGRGQGGRGRGRGRGGGGRGGQDKNKDPLKQPPKKGDPHERVENGKSQSWCGKCGRWGNHPTKDHKGKQEQANAAANESGGQGNAGGNAGGNGGGTPTGAQAAGTVWHGTPFNGSMIHFG